MKELLITSTVLIAVILLLRLLLKKRVSRRLIYATWLLVALRLLIPVQFGQFEYSVASTTERLEQQSQLVQQVQENLQQPVVNFDGQQRYEQLLEDLVQGKKNSPIFRHHIEYVNQSHYPRLVPYESSEPNQIVVDYIASMTDDYFIDLHHYLFPDSTYKVEYSGYFNKENDYEILHTLQCYSRTGKGRGDRARTSREA